MLARILSLPLPFGKQHTVARIETSSATCLTATRAIAAVPRVPASSRLIAYSSAVRRSRAPATRVCCRTLAISVAITSAIVSITPNVTRY